MNKPTNDRVHIRSRRDLEKYGEDGKVQAILDRIGVPYTGAKSVPSATCMNKHMSKKIYSDQGIKSPYGIVIKNNGDINEITQYVFRSMPMPVVMKPVVGGSSIGVYIVNTLPKIRAALDDLFTGTDSILVEEFISGKEATCGVVDNFRGNDIYSLLPIEIRPPENREFFDYEAKYSGETEEICPGNFSKEETAALQKMAIEAHNSLGLRHYSRSDFIIHPKRGIYILETNSLPGLTQESLLPKSIKAIGLEYADFLDHLIELAISDK